MYIKLVFITVLLLASSGSVYATEEQTIEVRTLTEGQASPNAKI